MCDMRPHDEAMDRHLRQDDASGESTRTRPGYADFMDMKSLSTAHAQAFAGQVLLTCGPDLTKQVGELDVLDVGSGYGAAAAVLASRCRSVTGIEPMLDLHAAAAELAAGIPNLNFHLGGIESLTDVDRYDLIVLDNVYEHLPDHEDALDRIDRALRPGGVVYLLMPNRLWPREVHYGLPFLAWLPLPLANRYLRWSGRGDDYTDASYAPTYWGLRHALRSRQSWSWRLTLPVDPTATLSGTPIHYRVGMAALRRAPALWVISKAFMVVAKKAS